ncbi:MAG TPA: hypothetical protein VNV38_15015 [Stellaceae bacterium]|jgi:hypothetical protein|nr:hypothetical protein [Stellaceae bacterium]
MLSKIGVQFGRHPRMLAITVIALTFAVFHAHSFNPRELYREMYPLEPVKQNAFQICDQSDPTFVRAVGVEREACYNKMPYVMAVAMGRVKPRTDPLLDPSHEAELLRLLATTPPQQPITAPRSFSNTAWVRALAPPCDPKPVLPTAANLAPNDSAPASGNSQHSALPPVLLSPNHAATASSPDTGKKVSGIDFLPAPDIGDAATPAIVPLAPQAGCGGA